MLLQLLPPRVQLTPSDARVRCLEKEGGLAVAFGVIGQLGLQSLDMVDREQ